MVLTDQQLRQELISYGETVPPITQRNREQLRARLDVLRSKTSTRATASPSRSHGTSSPSRARTTASPSKISGSPSRTRATASPSKISGSPSRTRATASPSKISGSPSRSRAAASPSRSSTTTTTGGSGRATRSKQTPNLIELSDSETESTSTGVLLSRSTRAGQTAPSVQTRSIALRSDDSPTSSAKTPGTMTTDVEQSIARHRREIQQLLDTARDRNRSTTTGATPSRSGQQHETSGKSSRSNSPSPSSKSSKNKQSSNSNKDTKSKESPKSDHEKGKKSSSLTRVSKPIKSFWKKYVNFIKNLFKIALITSILILGGLFLADKSIDLLPRRELITCSIKNATECEDMKPVIAAVRKQLQVRTGEVDCGFRPKTDILVPRAEVEKYLNEKGLKFNLGNEERWKALIKYIVEKPIGDIVIWNKDNQQTNSTVDASKLSTKEAIRSLTCRARQDVSKTLRNLILLILGSTGLLTLAWYFQRQSKTHEEKESIVRTYLDKATKLIQEEYEKHVKDPQAQPWLAINHIRDKLIPEQDQERLKDIWERVKNEISKQDSRIRSELQEIDGKKSDVWRWIKSAASSPSKKIKSVLKTTIDDTDDNPSSDVGLTQCLKLRNCFRSDNSADDEEIDQVVESIQNRCANIKQIEHIGIHSVFVYLKFSSNEAAAQGYHQLNNWKYNGRNINVKYLRLNRYYEHFPEAQNTSTI